MEFMKHVLPRFCSPVVHACGVSEALLCARTPTWLLSLSARVGVLALAVIPDMPAVPCNPAPCDELRVIATGASVGVGVMDDVV